MTVDFLFCVEGEGCFVMVVDEDYLASLLLKRFSAPGGMGVQRFVHVRHPQLLNSFVAPGKNRILDYLVFDRVAQNKWGAGSVLLESVRPVHGFEIKVSISALVVELKDLSKSEAWSKHCSHFWLVVSDKGVAEGLPAGVKIPDFGVCCV